MQSHMYVSGVHAVKQKQGEMLQRIVAFLPANTPHVPALRFLDALGAATNARVQTHSVESDKSVDAVIAEFLGESFTLTEPPTYRADTALLVAGGDAFLRSIARRIMRRVTPRPSQRPAWLASQRSIADLPPLGVIDVHANANLPSLTHTLAVPDTAEALAHAWIRGQYNNIDVLRNDHGSLTLHGVLLGSADSTGHTLGWRASVYVDEYELATPNDVIVAASVCNGDAYAAVGGVQLVDEAHPSDGVLSAGVAVYTESGNVQVRRASGRACSIDPLAQTGVHFTDDGVDGVLTRKKTWWVEPAALPLVGASPTLSA